MTIVAARADPIPHEWRTLADVFLAAHARHASRPALWVNGSEITYAELYRRAAHLASVIAAEGRVQEERRQCGILTNRTPAAYAAILGSLLAGAAYVPLNPRFPVDRLAAVLRSSACDTLVVDERSAAVAQPLVASATQRLRVVFADTRLPDWTAEHPAHTFLAHEDVVAAQPLTAIQKPAPESGAYLLFTSGSTGAPKGILITHRNVLTYLRNVFARYEPRPSDRFSQLFDFSFDLSVHDMFLCWGAGACLYCAPEGNILGLDDFIRRCRITHWFSVPSVAAFMARMHMLKPGRYESIRASLFCGEMLPVELARKWQDATPNGILDNLYGPTEATIAFTAFRLPRDHRGTDQLGSVPIGDPLPGQRAVVVDEAGNELPPGGAGELCLGGPQVAAGYWHAPGPTAEKFRAPKAAGSITQWYRTGDRAVLTPEHGLVFLGRIDRQVKILGHRVELSEIENVLRMAAGADLAAAVAWPVSSEGLAAGIVGFLLNSGKNEAEITAVCRQTLPAYMVPSKIVWLTAWPLNANGKTDYRRLQALLEDSGGGTDEREDQACSA